MQLRDFSGAAARGDTKIVATVIDAPYAGHHSTIADYAKGQSLVETLQSNGIRRVLCMDWKSATDQMKDYNIDIYLAEINATVDDLGGQINLIGLCQGGWMAAMFAARYPHKVATLVTAGAPLDCDAGEGFVKKIAKEQPMSFFEDLVIQGGGLMRGKFMLAGWKSMHPEEHYFKTYLDLYENVEDPAFIKKREEFERWYEHPLDLPGAWYLQAIKLLFKDNQLYKGTFSALGRKIGLGDIICPTFLMAGESDDITPPRRCLQPKQSLALRRIRSPRSWFRGAISACSWARKLSIISGPKSPHGSSGVCRSLTANICRSVGAARPRLGSRRWYHSALCIIIAPRGTGLRAVANIMPR